MLCHLNRAHDVGDEVGDVVGDALGILRDGAEVAGRRVGIGDGFEVGAFDGFRDGVSVGGRDGCSVGEDEGLSVSVDVGMKVGVKVMLETEAYLYDNCPDVAEGEEFVKRPRVFPMSSRVEAKRPEAT